MKFNLMCVVLFSIILTGCLSPTPPPTPPPAINWNNPIETKNRVIIEKDDFEKLIDYKGPIIRADASPSDVQNLNLRGITSLKTGKTLFQIYTFNRYRANGWKFYDRAYDLEGNKLEINLISKDVDCNSSSCRYTEIVGIMLTREYLEKYSEIGIKYKVSGKGGNGIFFLPSGYIKGFLEVVPK